MSIGVLLRGKVQLPQECWGTELQPFNELSGSAVDSWDVVEGIAQRLGVDVTFSGNTVALWLDRNNHGEFTNTTQGVEMAMHFLRGVAS